MIIIQIGVYAYIYIYIYIFVSEGVGLRGFGSKGGVTLSPEYYSENSFLTALSYMLVFCILNGLGRPIQPGGNSR